MKLKSVIAAAVVVTLLAACEHSKEAATPLVTWEKKGGQDVAVIKKQKGMQVTYFSRPKKVARITVPRNQIGNGSTIEVTRFPFVIRLLDGTKIIIPKANGLPCDSGDDCVPPPPPRLLRQLENFTPELRR